MPRPASRRRPRAADAPEDRKTPRTYRLSEAKIAAAQRILGAPTATATIETALDLVVFRQELLDGAAAMHGVWLSNIPDDDEGANA